MRLENKSYPKDFRNLIIQNLEFRKKELLINDIPGEDESIGEIERNIFILTNGLISEYDKINFDLHDSVLDADEITVNTAEEVKQILKLFFELEGYLKTDEQIKNHSGSHKLKFAGFNEHNDEDMDKGQILYAEYMIVYQKKYSIFEQIYMNGSGDIMEYYIKTLSFFQERKVSKDTIFEFLET